MPAPRKYSDELRERAVRMVEGDVEGQPGVGAQARLPHRSATSWASPGRCGGRRPVARRASGAAPEATARSTARVRGGVHHQAADDSTAPRRVNRG